MTVAFFYFENSPSRESLTISERSRCGNEKLHPIFLPKIWAKKHET